MGSPVDDLTMERIAFLKEQISPVNKPEVNATFQLQVEILQSVDLQKPDRSITMRKQNLKKTDDIREADRLFCELEALGWLQRQLSRQKVAYSSISKEKEMNEQCKTCLQF
jgi:hypothetical protein